MNEKTKERAIASIEQALCKLELRKTKLKNRLELLQQERKHKSKQFGAIHGTVHKIIYDIIYDAGTRGITTGEVVEEMRTLQPDVIRGRIDSAIWYFRKRGSITAIEQQGHRHKKKRRYVATSHIDKNYRPW